jgi:hypothetical protein
VSVSASSCRCPIGYIDGRGDGSDCRDVNECLIPNICDRDGKCTNTLGSYECECAAPALVARGNLCVCAKGYVRSTDGRCLAQDARACGSDDDCLTGHCVGDICCAVSCDSPDACHTAEGATCADGKTCSYRELPDGTSCDDAKACTVGSVCKAGACGAGKPLDCDDANPCTDDSCAEPVGCRNQNTQAKCDDANPCTQDDTCRAGSCSGRVMACEALDDACNLGACDEQSGQCRKTPRANGAPCDDANACSQGDSCAAGSCSTNHNACGPNATGCTVAGAGLQCSCAEGFVDGAAGWCVPMNNECAGQSRCSPDATCEDPSNATGDAVCTCNAGFRGDGVTCQAFDACADNPCGDQRGTCTATAPGEHSCACATGYRVQRNSCVCDLTGTFAMRSRLDLSWSDDSALIEPGSDSVYEYAIVHLRYDADGNLHLEQTPCGAGLFDLCGLGVAPTLAAEAYAQYVPLSAWDKASMPRVSARAQAPEGLPGTPFTSEVIAQLHGISLSDPRGQWPTSMRDVAGTPAFDGTAVNGARWLDHDDDGFVGLTSYVVPPGGIPASSAATAAAAPPRSYGATSAVCPREGGTHTPYNYWPVLDGSQGSAQPLRVKRYFAASRVQLAFRGTLTGCDKIEGALVGPDDQPITQDSRVGGCIRTHTDGETACPTSAVEWLDGVQPETVVKANFKLLRWPAGTPESCGAARSVSFD